LLVTVKAFTFENGTGGGGQKLNPGVERQWPVISNNVEVKPDMVVLRYQARPPDNQSGQRNDIQERVGLSFSSCNYGGRRPWFFVQCQNAIDMLRFYTFKAWTSSAASAHR
jgi:hypothetical protein